MAIASFAFVSEHVAFTAMQHRWVLQTSWWLFRLFAGLASIIRPLPIAVVEAACCTGPQGSGQCPGGWCSQGTFCNGVQCINAFGYCPTGTNCWNNGGSPACNRAGCFDCTCCDCFCTEPGGFSFYCYCTPC